MRRSILLSMLLATGLSMSAQTNVFSYGFEDSEEITDPSAVAYPEYVNFGIDNQGEEIGNSHEIVDYAARTGTKSLLVQNPEDMAGFWIGALKFRNLPIKSNTSYRVTYWAMATEGANVRAEMHCGEDESDIPFLAVGNVGFNDTYNGFEVESGEWQKRSAMFYYTNDEIQQEYYLTQSKKEPTLPEGYFLALSMYSAGEYYIDDISLDEANIQGITYAVDALRVNFGYKTDFSAAAQSPVMLDPSSVTVTINGEEAGIESVELKADGYMYIYLEEMIDSGSSVSVSFTNPKGEDGPKYSAEEARRPNSWSENDELYVLDFVAEVAEEDTDSEADYGFSCLYNTPVLVSVDPENGSFDLPNSFNTFTLTFNKLVNLSEVEAKLGSEKLVLTTEGEFATTLVFTRAGGDLPTGPYTLTVSNIQPEKYIEGLVDSATEEIEMYIGISVGGDEDIVEIFTEGFDEFADGACVPSGWKTSDGKVDNTGPVDKLDYTHGSRVFKFDGSTRMWDYGVYIRVAGGAEENSGYASYGDVDDEENRLFMEPGTYELSYDCLHWSTSDNTDPLRAQILDMDGNVIIEKDYTYPADVVLTGTGDSFSKTYGDAVKFTISTADNYVLKFVCLGPEWRTCHVISNIKLLKIPNLLGVREKKDLKEALEAAEKAMLSVSDKETGTVLEQYVNRPTTIALQNGIDKYSTFSATAPSAYAAATLDLKELTTALSNDKINVDLFAGNIQDAANAIEANQGTKYENLESYSIVYDLWNKYKDEIIYDDVRLAEVNETLSKNTAMLTNMAKFGVKLLTERITILAELAEKLGIDSDNELLVKAEAALTDDNDLATQLEWLCKDKLYADLTAGIDYFTGELEEGDSLNMSGFIKNPEMYVWVDVITNGKDSESNMQLGTLSSFCPGWSDEGSINGWGDWVVIQSTNDNGGADLFKTAVCEVGDALVKTWAAEAKVFQEIKYLPVGKYRLYTRTGNQDADTEEKPLTELCNQSIYAVVNGDSIGAAWSGNEHGWFGGGRKPYNSHVDFEVNELGSTVKIGVYSDTRNNGTNTFFNAFNLFMIGKSDTFDYANSIDEELVTPKEVKDVQFYSINGMLLKAAQKGLNIQKITYSDGTVKINKIFVK